MNPEPQTDLFQNPTTETIAFTDFQQFLNSLSARNQRISILVVSHGEYQVELVLREKNFPNLLTPNSMRQFSKVPI